MKTVQVVLKIREEAREAFRMYAEADGRNMSREFEHILHEYSLARGPVNPSDTVQLPSPTRTAHD